MFCLNLDKSVNRIDLFNHFSKYGRIQEIHLTEPSPKAPNSGFCSIIYKESKDLMTAYFRGVVADGRCTHTVLTKSVVCKTLAKVRPAKELKRESNNSTVLTKSVVCKTLAKVRLVKELERGVMIHRC